VGNRANPKETRKGEEIMKRLGFEIIPLVIISIITAIVANYIANHPEQGGITVLGWFIIIIEIALFGFFTGKQYDVTKPEKVKR
jgi:L-cystine uptake protein TcyP (sodium:dicarboxylate symporter family)